MLCEKSKELIAKFKEYKADGWTLMEIIRFVLLCMETLISVANELLELTGEQKADWVAAQLKDIYFVFNPDIPWVPEFIEKKLETAVLDAVLPGVIKFTYMKIFNKTDELTSL